MLLSQFGGGPGGIENNLMRFGLAAIFWGLLLVVAWYRQRKEELPREKLLVWGFGLGLARELFMFVSVSLQLMGVIALESVYFISAPLEHALSVAAVVMVAGSFLRYILDDDVLPFRYLRFGLGATVACYLATSWWWALYAVANPGSRFGQTWGGWLFRVIASVLIAVAIALLAKQRGWLRNIVLVALSFFFLNEFLMLFNSATHEAHTAIFCPIANSFHILAIPLLGYVYIREQSIERALAEQEVRRRNEELIALNTIATTISQAVDLEKMLNAVLGKVMQMVDMDMGQIHLLTDGRDTLSLVAQRGFPQEAELEIQPVKLGEGVIGRVAQSGEFFVKSQASDIPDMGTEIEQQKALCACASIPLKLQDRVLGVLSIFSRNHCELKSAEVQLLAAIGHQVGVAVENARLAEEASRVGILQELNRLRAELIANVSHELRAPLGLVKLSSTALLLDDVEFDRETQVRLLRNIDEEADRLEKIVDNLLDLSQIDSGQLRLDMQPADVGRLAKAVLKSREIQTAQHRFVHDFDEALIAVIDRKRIEQVLRNLLSNAIKYSPEGGTITVRGYKENEQLVIQVSDQGIGIPQEDLEQVFERFYRVENKVTQKVGGVGLGLAVCRSIVEAHGGRIWAESTHGHGSIFYVALDLNASGSEV